jgi:hypothetical protein
MGKDSNIKVTTEYKESGQHGLFQSEGIDRPKGKNKMKKIIGIIFGSSTILLLGLFLIGKFTPVGQKLVRIVSFTWGSPKVTVNDWTLETSASSKEPVKSLGFNSSFIVI